MGCHGCMRDTLLKLQADACHCSVNSGKQLSSAPPGLGRVWNWSSKMARAFVVGWGRVVNRFTSWCSPHSLTRVGVYVNSVDHQCAGSTDQGQSVPTWYKTKGLVGANSTTATTPGGLLRRRKTATQSLQKCSKQTWFVRPASQPQRLQTLPQSWQASSPPLLYWSWLVTLITYLNMSLTQLNHQTSPVVLTCRASFAGVAAAAAAARAASSKAPAPKAVLKQARVVHLSIVL